jgi:zinc protease
MNITRQRMLNCLTWITCLAIPVSAWSRPLPSDSRIHSGKLKNGVKWMYREHDNPPGRMALMLHVDSGSLNETDKQLGLAHFVEHLCFNGSENFPPGTLVPYFESIGMTFGAHLNAFTSFDQTVYMLFVPDTEHEQLDRAMTVLSDYAFRVTMPEEEIDKERGVVLEESRRGKSAFQRVRDKLWPELFEGTRFAKRLPIGDDEIIANAPRQEFVDYYKTWYRPENMTVILVGDTNVERVTPLIEKWFGDFEPDTPRREKKGPEFKPFTETRAMVVTDPEMATCQVQMLNIRPGRPPVTDTTQWRTELVESIGTWIMNRRLEERVQKGEANYRRASTSVNSFFNDALLIDGSASGEPHDWSKMLDELITEVHRAREHGFTQRELDLAKKELLSRAEHAVKTESTRNARAVAFQMVQAVNEREPVVSAEQELALHKEFVPAVELNEVNETFQRHFKPGTFAFTVTMAEKDNIRVPTRDEVLAVGRAAWERKVDPPTEQDAPTDLLAALPEPGKVVESRIDEDLGITQAWLSNNVRVHHRFMDYKKGTVLMSVNLAGGQIEETTENSGISELATIAVNEPATKRLSSTHVRDLMTGKNINVRASSGGDSFTINITGSPDDLEDGLKLVHALLTDGKIEEAAFNNWKLQTRQRIEMMEKMPMAKAFEGMAELLGGGDPRLTPMTKEKLERMSLESAQKWFDRLRKNAPIEVAVVGDIKLDEAMPLINRYLGSLSERPRKTEHLDKLRRLARQTGPLSREIMVETVTPQGMVIAGFVGCEGTNWNDGRALELASNILTSRLVKRIREELSLVYSVRSTNRPSWVYKDSGQFMSGAPCDPNNVDKVITEIFSLFESFAKDGPTEEELTNAKKQVANNLDTQMREPSYWWQVLQNHDLHGVDLNESKKEKEAFERFTAEQVQGVFRKYFKPERRFQVKAIPTGVDVESDDKGKTDDKKANAPREG